MDLRPLTDDEKTLLDALSTVYYQTVILMDKEIPLPERAAAMLKVEGLVDRIKRTGWVAPVESTVERVRGIRTTNPANSGGPE